MTPLEEAKRHAQFEIDSAAGTARFGHVTCVYGQEQIYIEKTNEAIQYAVENYPSELSLFPFLRAETEATGLPAKTIANQILQKRTEWVNLMAEIEYFRRKGKIEIQKAASSVELHNTKREYIEKLHNL